MKPHNRIIIPAMVCAGLLSACQWSSTGTQNASQESHYIGWGDDAGLAVIPRQKVTVPHSYHFAQHKSPKKHHSRDQNWVNQQNPQQYTIEIANQSSAAKVAKILHSTPKHERTAQIAYQGSHKKQYIGVYGSFATPEQAKQALKKLPPEMRQHAYVTQWKKVQRLKQVTNQDRKKKIDDHLPKKPDTSKVDTSKADTSPPSSS